MNTYYIFLLLAFCVNAEFSLQASDNSGVGSGFTPDMTQEEVFNLLDQEALKDPSKAPLIAVLKGMMSGLSKIGKEQFAPWTQSGDLDNPASAMPIITNLQELGNETKAKLEALEDQGQAPQGLTEEVFYYKIPKYPYNIETEESYSDSDMSE